MQGEVQLLIWIAGVHLVGMACVAVLLIPALRDNQGPLRRPDDGEDEGGGGPRRPPTPPAPPRGGIPLPDAEQARVRLRGPERLFDLLPRRERRPAREPDRQPERIPSRSRSGPGNRRRCGSAG